MQISPVQNSVQSQGSCCQANQASENQTQQRSGSSSLLSLALSNLTNSSTPSATTGNTAQTASTLTAASSGLGSLLQFGGGISAALGGLATIASKFGNMSLQTGATSGAIAGAGIGTLIAPGLGTLVGSAIGGAVGSGLSFITGGKGKEQVARDSLRSLLQSGSSPLVDSNYNLTLANGEKFNIGVEGSSSMLEGGAYNGKRYRFDVDWSMTNVDQVVGALDPLASYYSRIGSKSDSNRTATMVGWMLNAATSSGNVVENVASFYLQSGLDPATLSQSIGADFSEGKINQETKDARLATIQNLFSGSMQLSSEAA